MELTIVSCSENLGIISESHSRGSTVYGKVIREKPRTLQKMTPSQVLLQDSAWKPSCLVLIFKIFRTPFLYSCFYKNSKK